MKKIKLHFITIFLLLFSINSLFSQINLDDGLIAYYPFNGNTYDSTSNQYNATPFNNPTLTTGRWGQENSAYSFDGENDYMFVSHTQDLDFNNQSVYTISMWVNIPELQADESGIVNNILAKWSTSTSDGYPFGLRIYNQTDPDNHGKIWVGQYGNSSCNVWPQILSERTINDNKWHLILFQRDDSGNLRLYIDGSLEGEIDASTSCTISNTTELVIGKRNVNYNNRHLTGILDDIRIYNRVLTDAEINALNEMTITSITEEKEPEISIYPNPVYDGNIKLVIPSSTTIKSIKVYDSLGRFIYSPDDSRRMNVNHLKNGIYIFSITLKDGKMISKKVIIQNDIRA